MRANFQPKRRRDEDLAYLPCALFSTSAQETDAVVVEILVLGVFGEKPRKSTIHLLQKAFMLFKGLLLQYGGAQLTAASKGTNSNNVE